MPVGSIVELLKARVLITAGCWIKRVELAMRETALEGDRGTNRRGMSSSA